MNIMIKSANQYTKSVTETDTNNGLLDIEWIKISNKMINKNKLVKKKERKITEKNSQL